MGPDVADPGRELATLLRRRLVELLTTTRDALGATLSGLAAQDPPWPQPVAGPALLAPLDTADSPDPVVGAVLRLLASTLRAATGDATLHGWEPAPAAARGIAYAVRAGAGPGDLAVVLATDAQALTLLASGATAAPFRVELGPGWALTLSGAVAGRLAVRFAAGGTPEVTGTPGDSVTLAFARTAPGTPDVGTDPGPSLRLGDIAASVTVTVAPDGTPAVTGGFRGHGGSVGLAPGGLAALVKGLGPVPLDVDLDLDPATGVRLAGSTMLRTTIPVSVAVPGAVVGPLDVTLTVGPGASVGVGVSARLAVDLPGVPIQVDAHGIGIDVPLALGDGGALGLAGLLPAEPDGAGVALSLPVVQGAGAVRRSPDGSYSGLLALSIPPMSAAAFGVLSLDPLSFLVILSATFPPPGIQIGFGFAVSGVGGIVGVGRRVDSQALAQAVVDGTVADLLFPTDPQAHADRVISALPAIFPAAPGRVVVGPMFQLSWGGRLVSASIAVVLELPAPVRVTLLGKLRLALPDPAAPLVDIQVTIVGQIDTGEPSLWFLASLAGSSIVGIPLTGDLYLLTRGGDDPQFVLSAGGFHPAYTPPRGVPALHRLGMELGNGFLQMRAQVYFAVTSNTVQLGARIDLAAEVAGCGLRGFLAFDVLVQFDPFRFVAEISAGIAVEVLGETLAGISLWLALEGPAQWHARGRGSIELFLFSASFDFDTSWGDPAPQPLATPDVPAILQAALTERSAWTAQPPDLSRSPVQLSPAARVLLADGTAVHPHGRVTGRQRRVPLGITLERFERVPVAPQRWEVAEPVLAPGVPAETPSEVRDEFAAAAYLELSDDEQLGRPAFEPFRAGLSFSSDSIVVGLGRDVDLTWETSTIDDAPLVLSDLRLATLTTVLDVTSAARADHPVWWQPPAGRVDNVAAQYVPADTWSLTDAADLMPVAASFSEAHQATRTAERGRPLTVVEAWEVRG